MKVTAIPIGANLSSLRSAFDEIGYPLVISEDPDELMGSDLIILPGVGHAKEAMRYLKEQRLISLLRQRTRPILGICLGMQILFESSEEGETEALGLIPGRVTKIQTQGQSLPHMGWNSLTINQDYKFKEVAEGQHLYFVHSFRIPHGPWTMASCDYGESIPAILRWKNLYGFQFHPEKSGRIGTRLLKATLKDIQDEI